MYPLQITYTEGEEKALLEQLKEVLELLQTELNESLTEIDLENFKKTKLLFLGFEWRRHISAYILYILIY